MCGSVRARTRRSLSELTAASAAAVSVPPSTAGNRGPWQMIGVAQLHNTRLNGVLGQPKGSISGEGPGQHNR